MPNAIEPLPSIPEGLRDAAAQGTLVPFVGAGLSKLGGCPNWSEFAAGSLRFFVGKGKIDYSYLSQLDSLPPRVKLSLARGLEAEHNETIDYVSLLTPTAAADIAKGKRAYDGLSKLANVFVTTNYDEWLDTRPSPQATAPDGQGTMTSAPILRRNLYYKLEDLTYDKLLVPNTVLHIHGSMKDRSSMIVTTKDYVERYANHARVGDTYRENGYLVFLENLFRLRNVLFVGYGLEELEILEYVIQKARDAKAPTRSVAGRREAPRHFMVQGFYSHQRDLAASLERYYAEEIGVQLLPFSRDKKDWAQLVEVIEYLASEVPAGSTLGLRKRAELRSLLE